MSWFERVPKVELHLHLEGAIPHEALWQLIQAHGGDDTVPDRAALERRFRYRDFAHFIETWIWKNGFLRTYDDYTFIAEACARDLATQNVRYAEVYFSPSRAAEGGLETQPLTAAIRAGLDRVREVEIALIPDLVRDHGPEQAAITVAEVAELRELGVIGVGMGGSEQRFPPEPFAAAYADARRRGLHTTVHAGEAAGAESIWGAIRALEVERIGHATRAVDDPALLEHLRDTQIPLELCPLSNVATGVIGAIDEHPVARYAALGLNITINTDDPHMFGNSLAEEYRLLETEFGFSRDAIRQVILAAAHATWLSPERRAALAEALQADPSWMG